MKTKNVDLAAYLHLNGVDPVLVVKDRDGKREYIFPDGDELASLVRAFDNDAAVPVMTFVLARHTMKETRFGPYSKEKNFRNAIDQALYEAQNGVRRKK